MNFVSVTHRLLVTININKINKYGCILKRLRKPMMEEKRQGQMIAKYFSVSAKVPCC